MISTTPPPTDLAVERVNDYVHRIELPLPFEDLHVVNAYAVVGSTGVVLVDPGWSDPVSERILLDALAGLGAGLSDVAGTLVTHAHPDHFTLAADWQRRHGIPVHLGAGERPSVVAFSPELTRFPRQAELLERAGDPVLAHIIRELALEHYEAGMAWGEPEVWLSDGQVLHCGGEQVRVRDTPGHTRGHVVFEHVRSHALLTGDHLLPRITPSIGLELDPEPDALSHYLQSLDLLLRLEDRLMLPAHGPVSPSVHARARELLVHHDERLATITALVSVGLDTAAAIAAAMTWTRHRRTLHELSDVHRMTAVVEVLAHLDLLAERGGVRRRSDGRVDRFTSA